jgi:hypothetical protein
MWKGTKEKREEGKKSSLNSGIQVADGSSVGTILFPRFSYGVLRAVLELRSCDSESEFAQILLIWLINAFPVALPS